jgi:integrase
MLSTRRYPHHLSIEAKKELRDRRGTQIVSPHDLRHTAAVFRLSTYVAAGRTLDDSFQAMRAFFGWSYTSEMPRHYARAYFEDGLTAVWDTKFDTDIEALRQLDLKVMR